MHPAEAAKLALFQIYQELGGNVRQTSLLFHVESKRVRAIIKEIEHKISIGQSLKSIQSRASYYLIALPHLWQSNYPFIPDHACLKQRGLSAKEIAYIESQLPAECPSTRIIDQAEYHDLLAQLHELSQESLPEDQRLPFSDALLNHISFQLLHSKTVIRINFQALPIPLFALVRQSYSPQGAEERALAAIEDVA
jgi:hypothetical protein